MSPSEFVLGLMNRDIWDSREYLATTYSTLNWIYHSIKFRSSAGQPLQDRRLDEAYHGFRALKHDACEKLQINLNMNIDTLT